MTDQNQELQRLQLYIEGLALALESVAHGDYYDNEPEIRGDYSSDMAAYFEDVPDIEFVIDVNGDYRYTRILLTTGGPHATYETRNGWVEGYIGGGIYAKTRAESFATDAIDNYFKELYESSVAASKLNW